MGNTARLGRDCFSLQVSERFRLPILRNKHPKALSQRMECLQCL